MPRRGPKRKRAGRKAVPGERFPGGQRRAPHQRTEDPRQPGYEARRRVWRLSKDDATRPEASDYFGRLRIAGIRTGDADGISQRQYDAGNKYTELVMDYRRVIEVRRLSSASDYSRQPGHDDRDGTDPAYQAHCQRVESAYRAARSALLTCGDAMAPMVVDGVVLDGYRMTDLGALRTGLNALARVFHVPADPPVDTPGKSHH